MADLDDFFAKKDRKKSKTTKKFTTTPEELAKKIEETNIAVKKTEVKPPRKDVVQQPATVGADGAAVEEPVAVEEVQEDEWRDFEEEGRKDYSGLKLGQLQPKEDCSDFSEADGEGDDGEGGKNSGKSGPWNKGSAEALNAQKEAAAAAAAAAAATAAAAPPPAKSTLYVSPALRNLQNPLKPINLRKGALPDLGNEELFPTLGSVRPEDLKKKKNEPAFEEVKHGGRFQRSSDLPTNAPVSIGNRYGTLSDS